MASGLPSEGIFRYCLLRKDVMRLCHAYVGILVCFVCFVGPTCCWRSSTSKCRRRASGSTVVFEGEVSSFPCLCAHSRLPLCNCNSV